MWSILLGMTSGLNKISRPGWTGNLGALRIVKAAQRTLSSVDPIDRHSVVVYSRNVDSVVWSLALCVSPPVSVRLRGTETGGVNLAQGQTLRAFAATRVDAKVRKSASLAVVSGMMARPHLIRGRCKIDRPEMSRRARKDLFDPSVPLLEINSRAVERKKPSAAGASSGLELSDFRIDSDRQQGKDGEFDGDLWRAR